jgi:hypothetical protein
VSPASLALYEHIPLDANAQRGARALSLGQQALVAGSHGWEALRVEESPSHIDDYGNMRVLVRVDNFDDLSHCAANHGTLIRKGQTGR